MMKREQTHHVLTTSKTGPAAVMLALALLPSTAGAQDFLSRPIYERPHTKLEAVWQFSKIASLAAAEADAITTARAIDRGYVEASPLVNFMIPRNRPAYSARSARYVGEAYLINMIFNRLYKACDNKLCRVAAIAGRGVFTGFSIRNAIHNERLK